MARQSFPRRAVAAVAAAALALAGAVAAPFRRGGGTRERLALGDGGPSWWAAATSAQPIAPPRLGVGLGEFALDYVEHPEIGIIVERINSIFAEAEMGWPRRQCELIDGLVEGDPTLRNLFDQRSAAVAGKPYAIQEGAGGELDKAAARALAAALKRLPMIAFFDHQLGFNRYGWAATYVVWGTLDFEGRTWVVPVELVHVPARRFKINPQTNELRLLTKAAPIEGEALQPGCWIVTTAPGSRLARAGLMRTAAWPACWKRWATRDWIRLASKYGLPLFLVKIKDRADGVEVDTDDKTKRMGEQIIRNLGKDGGAVVTDGLDVEIKETATSGDGSKTHGSLVAHCNAQMSQLIAGATLTNDNSSGSSSYALGNVHMAVRWEAVQADAARLEESLRTQLGVPFIDFNGVAAASPILRMQVVRDLDPNSRVEVATAYLDLGGEVSRTQMTQDLGLREPLNDDDVLSRAKTPAPSAAAKPAATTTRLREAA